MPITAPAPHFVGHGAIEWSEHTYADPGDRELLIRVAANAICGTDRNEYDHGSAIVPGHEAAGTVVAAGGGAATAVGSRGVIYLMDYCGACRSCRVGATNQCLAKRADVGQTSDGGYGPYALVHETNFFPVADRIPLDTATMLLDVMGTSTHALRRAELVRGDIQSIYVAGAGPIGLGLLAMTKLRYGTDFPVYISDVSAWRRSYAEQLGGTPVDATDAQQLASISADVAFDSSGKTAARQAALDLISKRGALVCVGHGEGLALTVSSDLIAPERAVLGSEYFRYDEMADNHRVLESNLDYISRIITHRFDVSDIEDAFTLFLSGQSGKVVVTQENRS